MKTRILEMALAFVATLVVGATVLAQPSGGVKWWCNDDTYRCTDTPQCPTGTGTCPSCTHPFNFQERCEQAETGSCEVQTTVNDGCDKRRDGICQADDTCFIMAPTGESCPQEKCQ